ncbi:phosphoribosylanthranilate isomerase [Mesohalobacter halotolerans]|uniref:N-(5'-phosphoribosyl)anthranilate isomerase n=1 Tax=Mesohalobacter halotolerans TaxID=1883405 RepID=A0A4U5TQA9_9FLAO|nr:phosphoribosylanthranilate isomerase [Mesohalobacter halotolerans]MBS3739299.1 phosphoribosylanthranilate isomerase [Psychroflexus sp.]TKS55524.1 phosphoribosylanthranilate isomerase [Mesohalobacter halotolerans]
MVVKVCGMTAIKNLEAIQTAQPDYFGFIFYDQSPRAVQLTDMPNFQHIKKIGVFVDEDIEFILENHKQFRLDGIQLHGNENSVYIEKLKAKLPTSIEIFKAVSIKSKSDFEVIKTFEGVVDKIILDTKTHLKGGSGQQFDWALLENYTFDMPFLLSGGIGPNDAEQVLKLFHKYPVMAGVDINSKFEIEPGIKNIKHIKKFIKTIKS